MSDFEYKPIYKLFNFDSIKFDKISDDHITDMEVKGESYLKIDKKALTKIAKKSFSNINYFFSKSHLQKLSGILKDENASKNDKFVANKLIENAVIASSKIFPICQDTGTATIVCEKGDKVLTGFDEKKALSQGIFDTYTNENLRYSQLIPDSLFVEQNSKTNLPGQIDIYSGKGCRFNFLFSAKGGGSSNKTFFFTENKSILNRNSLISFLKENIKKIGTAACPPYHLGIVIGGLSPEMNLKTLKLATMQSLDYLPHKKNDNYLAIRDNQIEEEVNKICENLGMGAQYGGKYFILDNRVIRLPRHGASVFVGIGVSCYGHRNQYGYIDEDGIFLEKLEKDPALYLPEIEIDTKDNVNINLNRPMDEIRNDLSKLKVSSQVILNGDIIVARDIAHAKILELLDSGKPLPNYFKNHPIYYAGPAKIPDGYTSGSFGPTTSARMDSYVEKFQSNNGSLIMIGKGNRSKIVTKSCKDNGGFYLGAIGGAAALVGKECIKKVETIDFEGLGMEAVFKISVKNFPTFIIVDDKGNDFFEKI